MSEKLIQIENVDGVLVVDSRLIASHLGLKHKSFKATIEKYKTEIEKDFSQLLFEIDTVQNSVGAVNQIGFYYLNENQATYLMTLSRNTEKVRACKRQLVQSFSKAKELLKYQSQPQLPTITDKTIEVHTNAIQMFTDSADLQLSQLLKSRLGNLLLAEQQKMLAPSSIEQYEGAVDVAIRLGFAVPANYEGSLGTAVKKRCSHLLIGKNNRYSTASHKQVPANMYPAYHPEVEAVVTDYCVSKAFRHNDIELI